MSESLFLLDEGPSPSNQLCKDKTPLSIQLDTLTMTPDNLLSIVAHIKFEALVSANRTSTGLASL